MNYVFIDYETYSDIDLKKCGMVKYLTDFEPLMLGYAISDNDSAQIITTDFYDRLKDMMKLIPEICFVAHNAHFEKRITEHILGRKLPESMFVCTMAMCATLSLPQGLDKALEVTGLGNKHKEGKRLIQKFCKPRKPSKHRPETRNYPEAFPEEFEVFKEYCRQDVEMERELFKYLNMVRQ